MAVKIVRQPNKIALIGAASSAAGFSPGTEKAPAALRAAGIVERLQSIGYQVEDFGDCAPRLFADDDEHKRARNLPEIVASLNDLKPRGELRYCWERFAGACSLLGRASACARTGHPDLWTGAS